MANDKLERGILVGEALLRADVRKVGLHLVGANGVEVKALDAREDRGQDLLRVGGAHDEDHVARGLLERLEQRIERRRREHVDLVDDVNLVAAANRRIVDAADDLLADVVDARTRGSVQLKHVRVLARRNELALLAGAVGQVTCAALAHEGLCQDARHGGLAGSARSAEEVRMAHLALENRAFEGLDHVFLANDLFERLWAVLRVERFHGTSAPSCLRFPVYPRASAMGHAPPRHLERRPHAATAPLDTTISVKTRFREKLTPEQAFRTGSRFRRKQAFSLSFIARNFLIRTLLTGVIHCFPGKSRNNGGQKDHWPDRVTAHTATGMMESSRYCCQ